MTRKEAIHEIQMSYDISEDTKDMAIKALEEQLPLVDLSKTVNREELENIMKNCPMMLITPGTEKIELIKEQQWIPCSERLPKEMGTYMTTVDYGKQGLAVGQRYYYGKNLGWTDDCVVAWMPLPEPYKGVMQWNG